jgi:hypothetical protein
MARLIKLCRSSGENSGNDILSARINRIAKRVNLTLNPVWVLADKAERQLAQAGGPESVEGSEGWCHQ